jgi:FolB domain-containing protein
MDRISLTGIRCETLLGASEEERAMPQLVELDIEIEADLSAASASDELGDTIDYGPIIEGVVRTVEAGSHALLEALAGTVAREVLATSPRIVAVVVRVRKPAVPLDVDMDHAQVEIRRSRA